MDKKTLFIFRNDLRYEDNPTLNFVCGITPKLNVFATVLFRHFDLKSYPAPLLKSKLKLAWCKKHKIAPFIDTSEKFEDLIKFIKDNKFEVIAWNRSADSIYAKDDLELISILNDLKISWISFQSGSIWDNQFNDNIYMDFETNNCRVFKSTRLFPKNYYFRKASYFIEDLKEKMPSVQLLPPTTKPKSIKTKYGDDLHEIINTKFADLHVKTKEALTGMGIVFNTKAKASKIGGLETFIITENLPETEGFYKMYSGLIRSEVTYPSTIRETIFKLIKDPSISTTIFNLTGRLNPKINTINIGIWISLGVVSYGEILNAIKEQPDEYKRGVLLSWVFAREYMYHKTTLTRMYKGSAGLLSLFCYDLTMSQTDDMMFIGTDKALDRRGGAKLEPPKQSTMSDFDIIRQQYEQHKANALESLAFLKTFKVPSTTQPVKFSLSVNPEKLKSQIGYLQTHTNVTNLQNIIKYHTDKVSGFHDFVNNELNRHEQINMQLKKLNIVPKPEPVLGCTKEEGVDAAFVSFDDQEYITFHFKNELQALLFKNHNAPATIYHNCIGNIKADTFKKWWDSNLLVIKTPVDIPTPLVKYDYTKYVNLTHACINALIRSGSVNCDVIFMLAGCLKLQQKSFKSTLLRLLYMFALDYDYLLSAYCYEHSNIISNNISDLNTTSKKFIDTFR